jgi:mannose-6-phosphate isomerase-like protein (cupin superfamily)
MSIALKSALSSLPLPATTAWPEGVWDKTVFSHGTMSVLVFTPRGRDYQNTHTQDELYIIMKGSGTLLIEDTPFPFVEGDVLFVRAGKHHRFSDFTPDLITWAIFWGPPGGDESPTHRVIQT